MGHSTLAPNTKVCLLMACQSSCCTLQRKPVSGLFHLGAEYKVRLTPHGLSNLPLYFATGTYDWVIPPWRRIPKCALLLMACQSSCCNLQQEPANGLFHIGAEYQSVPDDDDDDVFVVPNPRAILSRQEKGTGALQWTQRWLVGAKRPSPKCALLLTACQSSRCTLQRKPVNGLFHLGAEYQSVPPHGLSKLPLYSATETCKWAISPRRRIPKCASSRPVKAPVVICK